MRRSRMHAPNGVPVQARLAATENALSQEVLDLVLRLGNLRLALEGLKVRGDYRELYLDRSARSTSWK